MANVPRRCSQAHSARTHFVPPGYNISLCGVVSTAWGTAESWCTCRRCQSLDSTFHRASVGEYNPRNVAERNRLRQLAQIGLLVQRAGGWSLRLGDVPTLPEPAALPPAPQPVAYRLVCVSLYHDDVHRLDRLVEVARQHDRRANKSKIMREALRIYEAMGGDHA